MDWYYIVDGVQSGPISDEAIRVLVSKGLITSDSPVWRSGMSDWQPAGSLPDLFVASELPLPRQPNLQGDSTKTTAKAEPTPAGIHPASTPEGTQQPAAKFNSNTGPALFATVFFSLVIATSAIGILVAIGELKMLFEMEQALTAGASIDQSTIEAQEAVYLLVGSVAGFLYFFTAIPFLIWFRRAYRNLLFLGIKALNYSPGWAVGGWFVPFLNLVRPYQIAKEIWVQSYRSNAIPGDTQHRQLNLSFVGAWWSLFLVMNFVGTFSSKVYAGAETLDGLQFAAITDILDALVTIPAAILAIKLVRAIQKMQAGGANQIRMRFGI